MSHRLLDRLFKFLMVLGFFFVFVFVFVFLWVLGFGLGASHLQGRYSTT
jgi:hypothetical protein